MKNLADTGDVKITPEIPSITDEAKRLKNQGVDILIALGHSGFEMDTKIAEQVSDIDVVIGGHSNTFLYSGKYYKNYIKKLVYVILFIYAKHMFFPYLPVLNVLYVYHVLIEYDVFLFFVPSRKRTGYRHS